MGRLSDLASVAGTTFRLYAAGIIMPSSIRQALDAEEMHAKLRVVCAEHYDTALAWIEWRRTWGRVERLAWIVAAQDEYRHAICYGPHDIPPNIAKCEGRWGPK